MERHLDRPNHQVGGSGEWVVGCGWRNTWIGPTIRWVGGVSGWLGVGGETRIGLPDHQMGRWVGWLGVGGETPG